MKASAKSRSEEQKSAAREAYFRKIAKDVPLQSTEIAERIGLTPQAVSKARREKPSNFFLYLVAYFSEIPYDSFKRLPRSDMQKIVDSFRDDIEDAMRPEKLTGKNIMVYNTKGGVGKSTLCMLLDLPGSVILNLDTSQNAKEYNPKGTTVNYAEMRKNESVDHPIEAIRNLHRQKYDYVIVDTRAGSVDDVSTQELLDAFSLADLIIVPFIPTDRSYVTTAHSIKMAFRHNPNIVAKWALVANNYEPSMEEEADEMLANLSALVEKHAGEGSVAFTHKIRKSAAIATLENTQSSVEALAKEIPAAYSKLRDSARKLRSLTIKTLLEVE